MQKKHDRSDVADNSSWHAAFQTGAPKVLPSQLDAGKTLPNQVQAKAKEEWADAMSAAAAAAEHARRAQDASDAAERYARGSNSSAARVSPIAPLVMSMSRAGHAGHRSREIGVRQHPCDRQQWRALLGGTTLFLLMWVVLAP